MGSAGAAHLDLAGRQRDELRADLVEQRRALLIAGLERRRVCSSVGRAQQQQQQQQCVTAVCAVLACVVAGRAWPVCAHPCPAKACTRRGPAPMI